MANTFRKIYKKTGNSGSASDYQLVGNVGVDGVELDIMKGASSSVDGELGLVPKPIKGEEDYVLSGDGTWKNIDSFLSNSDTINSLKEDIDYKRRWINVKNTTDPYGQCDFQQYLDSGDETASVLSVHIDGGYGAFVISGNFGRIFKISALPFEFASSMTLNGYILYATKIHHDI